MKTQIAKSTAQKAEETKVLKASASDKEAVAKMNLKIAKEVYDRIKKENKAVKHPTPAIKRE